MNWKVLQGDCLSVLRAMPDESVQGVVTSPPYFGLRDYGIEPTVWGGDSECEHEWIEHVTPAANGLVNNTMQGETLSGTSATRRPRKSNFCRCGAWRGSFGLEPSPDLYVAHAVEIFREVRRVLRKDGVMWLNIGDSYSSGGRSTYRSGASQNKAHHVQNDMPRPDTPPGLKPKDLIGIPWQLAFALRADGWYLRSDTIWHKPNPMPESVRDRPTKSHEYVFLLTKSPKYFYDAEAVAEKSITEDTRRPYTSEGSWQMDGRPKEQRHGGEPRNPGNRKAREGVDTAGGNQAAGAIPNTETRNARSVWTIATEPFPEAHFATFPTALVERCVLAGTSAHGCCSECGSPWVRMLESVRRPTRPGEKTKIEGTNSRMHISRDHKHPTELHGKTRRDGLEVGNRDPQRHVTEVKTVGWKPACKCKAESIGCTVLDPFSGSGTTGVVCVGLGRSYIGIELNPEYVEMSKRRIGGVAPLFTSEIKELVP